MKIVIIGGSGLIGSKLVAILRQRGHEAIAASPASGVNTITGEGLAQVLAGADVVVDVANSPSFEDEAVLEFFETSGRNLVAAEAKAGLKHHVALSVVGTDRLPESGYFRAKSAQETLIRNSPIPYTIVHSTQFFEFLGAIVKSATAAEGGPLHVSPAFVQPISSDDVAAALADYALGQPSNRVVEIAGPERVRLSELVQRYLTSINDSRNVVADVHARCYGAELADDSLVPGNDPRLGTVSIDAFLARAARSQTKRRWTLPHGKTRTNLLAGLAVLTVAGCAFVAGRAWAAPAPAPAPAPIVRQVMSKELSNIPGKEGLVLTVEYPPGGADPVHRHDANAFVYVLEGSIVMGLKGQPEVTLGPGQSFYEGPNDIHTIGRNASKTQPAKFVVFLVKEKDAPALKPVK